MRKLSWLLAVTLACAAPVVVYAWASIGVTATHLGGGLVRVDASWGITPGSTGGVVDIDWEDAGSETFSFEGSYGSLSSTRQYSGCGWRIIVGSVTNNDTSETGWGLDWVNPC